jgi:hypothetical protein
MKAVYYLLAVSLALLLSLGITGLFVVCSSNSIEDITLVGWIATTLVTLCLVCVSIMIVHDATKPTKEDGVHHTI